MVQVGRILVAPVESGCWGCEARQIASLGHGTGRTRPTLRPGATLHEFALTPSTPQAFSDVISRNKASLFFLFILLLVRPHTQKCGPASRRGQQETMRVDSRVPRPCSRVSRERQGGSGNQASQQRVA